MTIAKMIRNLQGMYDRLEEVERQMDAAAQEVYDIRITLSVISEELEKYDGD